MFINNSKGFYSLNSKSNVFNVSLTVGCVKEEQVGFITLDQTKNILAFPCP